MKINRILLSVSVVIFLMFYHLSGYTQIGKMDLHSTRADTVQITFLNNFNYDVALIYLNGIEVFSDILYSKRETGTTYNSFKIFFTVKEIVLDVVVFERNQNFSIEYNPLWYDWNIGTDPAFYYAPVKETRKIIPNVDGKFLFVSLEETKNPDGEIRKMPIISITKNPIILD
jgi:hypothetical protein